MLLSSLPPGTAVRIPFRTAHAPPPWLPRTALRWIPRGLQGRKNSSNKALVLRPAASSGGDGSYLSMWKRAKDREEEARQEVTESQRAAEESQRAQAADWSMKDRREKQFQQMLEVPEKERSDAISRAVVDRAAAAIAAAQATLAEATRSSGMGSDGPGIFTGSFRRPKKSADVSPYSSISSSGSQDWGGGGGGAGGGGGSTPGPDFWSWTPPPATDSLRGGVENFRRDGGGAGPQLQRMKASAPRPSAPVLEKERPTGSLPLMFESEVLFGGASLPPLQSLLEVRPDPLTNFLETHEVDESAAFSELQLPFVDAMRMPSTMAEQMQKAAEGATSGVTEDGMRWWRETGVEKRPGGLVCEWTIVRGVSADEETEWEEKWWETTDAFDYKELGAEKSGRSASGAVWRETWKEAMWQLSSNGLPVIEKSADKWGQDGAGGEWHEKWWEKYDALGGAEKSADKWSKIDINTPLEPGHAHVWHERWGEKYDGHGAASKYTDKWAERAEYGGGWTKWGDKWDEGFDQHANGQKQGETWWEGANGERWNRTWGEDHNGSGHVHKYGQSSSGEHWDNYEEMDTWYERRPHFGFRECLENSYKLKNVGTRRKGKL